MTTTPQNPTPAASGLGDAEVRSWLSDYADILTDEGKSSEASKVHAALAAQPAPGVGGDALAGKYGDVLRPFLALMERELHANASKGDRPGWLAMTPAVALLEIYYHVSKLQKAVKNSDGDKIIENAADVANMAMMLLDVCGGLDVQALSTRPAESVAQGGMGGIVSEESVQSAYCVADAYIDSKGGDVSTLDDGHWGEMLRLVLENDRKEFAP